MRKNYARKRQEEKRSRYIEEEEEGYYFIKNDAGHPTRSPTSYPTANRITKEFQPEQ